jgi:iron complex transport system ATP-binding protein
MAEPLLLTEKLSVGYNKKPIIDGIQINVDKGQIVTLIGPNGAGKSTILKTICRQLPSVSGTVYINGRKIEQLSGKELSRSVSALLTEKVRTEFMRCIDVVEMGRYPYTGNLGLLSENDRQKVAEAMKMVDIEALAELDYDKISDGQRQRVLLAGAICRNPELLILDEPTTFLDIKYKLELMRILKRLAAERKTAIILSLHELELAQRISDTIICVNNNKIDKIGSPEDIFKGGYINKLYGVSAECFCEAYGSTELERSSGEPMVFVIGGGQQAISIYRRLWRLGIPFAAGVIHENDISFPAASALATKIVTEKAFEAISEESIEKAAVIMKKCNKVISASANFGAMNSGCIRLINEARSLGILDEGTV